MIDASFGLGEAIVSFALKGQLPELLPPYIPAKKTPLMKSARSAMFKVALGYLGPSIKMLLTNPEKVAREYDDLVEENIVALRALKNDRPFDEVIEAGWETMAGIWNRMGAYYVGMLARHKIDKMFKGRGLDDELAAMGSELEGNVTARMGRAMFDLACHEEFKATADAQEFAAKIASRSYSERFMGMVDDFLFRHGDRGIREIDIATPRPRNEPEELYRRLAAIDTEHNQLTCAAERKVAAYERLRQVADELGKRKKFDKTAATFEALFSRRETPKYLVVMMTGMLHDFALQEGEKFVAQGRLDRAEQVFDLHMAELVAAQKDQEMPLRPLLEANTATIKAFAHVMRWPTTFDSRGRIIRATRRGEEGDLVGAGISSGVVQGRAKVLASPYEKPLEPGEILVTHASEPSWTPIFSNASGVVLEVGGPMQHGAIIAREYAIPGVSGIDDATLVIKDGDLLEVDGTNGIVKVLKNDQGE